jgi:Transposase DDE domain
MCQSTLAIYCFIDDLLKSLGHKQDVRAEVTDSEVITIALIAMLYFGGNFEKSRVVLSELGLMKRMLSRSRFNRRLHQVSDLIELIFHRFGSILKDLNWESRYLLDSFPVALCDNIRIARCRIVRDERFRGYQSSKRRYFYGVRVQVITRADGVPVEFSILPGKFADIEGLAQLPLALPEGAHLIADSAYTYLEWEEHLQQTQRLHLLVVAKSNTRRNIEPRLEEYKKLFRKRIETAFGELMKLFPKKIHVTSLKGFILKISLFLLAFQIDKAIINN